MSDRMLTYRKSHRRSNYIAMKREIEYVKKLPELRENAEANRDRAYEKKYGKRTSVAASCFTRQDYLNKYFKMEAV